MTVYELFQKVDINLLADTLKVQHKHNFKNKKKTIKILKIFYADINSKERIPLDEEDEDFLVVCKPILDDLGKDFKNAKDVKETKLEMYLAVDGIHRKELIEKKDALNMTYEEVLNAEGLVMPTSYGIDFVERGKILNYEVSRASLEWYGLYTVAAEVFWEMTFYGLIEEQVAEKRENLMERVKEVDEYFKEEKEEKEEIEEIEKNESEPSKTLSEKLEEASKESEEESEEELKKKKKNKKKKFKKVKFKMSKKEHKRIMETMRAVGEINQKHTVDLYKRILELDCD